MPVDASDHSGWSSENDPWGLGSGTGGSSGSNTGYLGNYGFEIGGANYDENNDYDSALYVYPFTQTSIAYGAPIRLTQYGSNWGFSLNLSKVATALFDAAVAALKNPLKLNLVGVLAYALTPSEIAPDDPNVTARIITALPASKVTNVSLPTQAATVSVQNRVVDVITNNKQHLAVVNSGSMKIPVIDVQPTSLAGVYTARVIPGMAPLFVNVLDRKVTFVNPTSGVHSESPSSFSTDGLTTGMNTWDAILRFPKDSVGFSPIYVSMTNILPAAIIQQQQKELDARRQAAWDVDHALEAAQKQLATDTASYNAAQNAYNAAVKNQASAQNAFNGVSGINYAQEKADLATLQAESNVWGQRLHQITGAGTGDQFTPGSAAFNAYRNVTMNIERLKPLIAAKQSTISNYDKAKANLDTANKALSIALESRNKADSKKKSSETKVAEEAKKPRKGVAENGHDYIPVPKTEDIKGLGDLVKGKAKTPRQGGGGTRARWYDTKGKKVYEWDYQHGEIEGYRASDGQHIGVFDPSTGKQTKPADPKRNIKKYL